MDCGVAAIYLKNSIVSYAEGGAAFYMHLMLTALQHRGQQSAGFASFNPSRQTSPLDVHKELGLVSEVFGVSKKELYKEVMRNFSGTTAIGHVRYGTSGSNGDERKSREETQPFHRRHTRAKKHYTFAWNGNLANYRELRQKLEASGDFRLDSEVDTELLMHYLSVGLKEDIDSDGKVDIERVLRNTMPRFDGSYSVVMLDATGTLTAFRDPKGFMPLCWGENKDMIAIASETRALNKVGIYEHQDVTPGSFIEITSNRAIRKGHFGEGVYTPCFFQWMYFANNMSIMDGLPVKKFREAVADEMAKNEPYRGQLTDQWVVLPVPETSLPIAQRMASALGIRCIEDALIKDTSIRAFIEKEEQRDRLLAVKYNLDPSELRGKNIIVVDDSIVRGDTSKKLMGLIRQAAQPASIHLRSASPPIVSPCFYGVDFPTLKELIAHRYPRSELEAKLAQLWEIESVRYLPVQSIQTIFAKAGKENTCIACLTGNYPTPAGQQRLEELLNP